MDKEFMNDPALAPFLFGKDFEVEDSDAKKDKSATKRSKSKNAIPPEARFPTKDESYYINTFDDVTSDLSKNNEFNKEMDKLMGILGRIYKLDNHKPYDRLGKSTSRKLVLVNLLLQYLGDSTFNTVILGGNVNEYVYYLYPKNKLGTLFTHVQKVNYKDGEDGRRAVLGQDYRIFIDEVYKFANKYLKEYK